jgi:hypothetical protein
MSSGKTTLAFVETLLNRFSDELGYHTSQSHSLLSISLEENSEVSICDDNSLKAYHLPPVLISFLSEYFSEELFEDASSIDFTEEDKDHSDFKVVFQYLFNIVYLCITSYYLSFNLPVCNLQVSEKFIAYKTDSSSLFSFLDSHVYFKVFVPLEDCHASFMYKNTEQNFVCFKKNNLYVVPFTICNSISCLKGTHLVFNFSS